MKVLFRSRRSQTGFTLMELLVTSVIGLLVVLAILAVYLFQRQASARQSALTDVLMNTQYTLHEAQYYAMHAGVGLPAQGNCYVAENSGELIVFANWSKQTAVPTAFAANAGNGAWTDFTLNPSAESLFVDIPFVYLFSTSGWSDFEVAAYDTVADPPVLTAMIPVGDLGANLVLHPLEKIVLGIDGDGDFRVRTEKGTVGASVLSDLTLAEGIVNLDFDYTLTTGGAPQATPPADCGTLERIRIFVEAQSVNPRFQHYTKQLETSFRYARSL